MKIISKNIREIASQKRITLKNLADHLDITRQTMYNRLDNNQWSDDDIAAIAAYMQVTVEQLERGERTSVDSLSTDDTELSFEVLKEMLKMKNREIELLEEIIKLERIIKEFHKH